MGDFQKFNFRKTFGYSEQQKSARTDFISKEHLSNRRFKIGTALTGSISNLHIAIFLFFQLSNYSLSTWYIKFYCLHKCNASMIFFPLKYKPVLNLLKAEKDYKEYNWYFHVIILKRFKRYLQSLRWRKYNRERDVNGVIEALKQMFVFYDEFEREKKCPIFIGNLTETVYELALTVDQGGEYNLHDVMSLFELLVCETKDEELLKILTALQIFIENDKSDSLAGKFTKNMWQVIYNGTQDQNLDIKQSCKDILTFFILSSQPLPQAYCQTQTPQDIILSKNINKIT